MWKRCMSLGWKNRKRHFYGWDPQQGCAYVWYTAGMQDFARLKKKNWKRIWRWKRRESSFSEGEYTEGVGWPVGNVIPFFPFSSGKIFPSFIFLPLRVYLSIPIPIAFLRLRLHFRLRFRLRFLLFLFLPHWVDLYSIINFVRSERSI